MRQKLPVLLASAALLFAVAGFVASYTVNQSREEVQIIENPTPKVLSTPLNSSISQTSQIFPISPTLSNLILGEEMEQTGQLSVNEATMEELDSVSGIGPATAQKIIDGRPWTSLKDALKLVSSRYREEARERLKL